jgi:hypothetical protein
MSKAELGILEGPHRPIPRRVIPSKCMTTDGHDWVVGLDNFKGPLYSFRKRHRPIGPGWEWVACSVCLFAYQRKQKPRECTECFQPLPASATNHPPAMCKGCYRIHRRKQNAANQLVYEARHGERKRAQRRDWWARLGSEGRRARQRKKKEAA